jgi:signal transduction histidine kinase
VRLLPDALRWRLALLFTVLVAGVLALAVVLLGFAADAQLDAAVDSGTQTRTDALLSALGNGATDVLDRDVLAELVGRDGTLVQASLSLASEERPGRSALLVSRATLARAAAGTVVGERRVPDLGERVRYRVTPVPDGSGHLLVVASRLTEVRAAEDRILLLFSAGAPVLALGLGVAGWLLAAAALRPVAALTSRASQISAADVDQRLPQPPGQDEIAQLARTLNRMLGRLADGVRREREFVDDAAHELRTPIAVLRGELELALRSSGPMDPEVRESVTSALAEAERLSRLAQDLLALATSERAATPLEVVQLLALVRAEAGRLSAAHAVRLEVEGTEVAVAGDAHDLGRLLANLVANAEAAGAHRVVLRVEAEPRHAWLVVSDDGPGFPPALVRTALERFTRGDAARTRGTSGAGLGLAIVAAVVRRHGGTIDLSGSGPLPGACIRVRLPRLEPSAGPQAGEPAALEAAPASTPAPTG